ncbi:MAG: histidine phosphatase family protein, partial [Candidatus Aenigmatarchaeota archaeon]
LEFCPKFFGLPDLAKILVKTKILTEEFDERKNSFEEKLFSLGKKLKKSNDQIEKAISLALLEEKKEMEKEKENFFKKIAKKYSDKTVLIVTHDAVIMELLFYLTKLPRNEYRKLEQDKTALNIIKINKDGTSQIELINNTDHLNSPLMSKTR